MHIGTFTREGTWQAARRELAGTGAPGITVIELMPVADFPGGFGWGYDGVGWFAPVTLYGEPDDFRRFVDDAHRLGLGVILDVVYNHFGPDGNYLKQFSDDLLHRPLRERMGRGHQLRRRRTPRRCANSSRANAAYWADEFHLDGLRLDATQQIFDASPEHIMAALATQLPRGGAADARPSSWPRTKSRNRRLARPCRRGLWPGRPLERRFSSHRARWPLTGRNEAYYTDYLGTPQELISAVKYGYLLPGPALQLAGQAPRHARLGTAAGAVRHLHPESRPGGQFRPRRAADRLTSPGPAEGVTALLLLAPGHADAVSRAGICIVQSVLLLRRSSAANLGTLVRRGPHPVSGPISQPGAAGNARRITRIPATRATFERCKLDFGERASHAAIYRLHQDLLRLRREDPVFRAQSPRGVDGAVLGPEAFVLRFFGDGRRRPAAAGEPGSRSAAGTGARAAAGAAGGQTLEAALVDARIRAYGGSGTAPLDHGDNWRFPAMPPWSCCRPRRRGHGEI